MADDEIKAKRELAGIWTWLRRSWLGLGLVLNLAALGGVAWLVWDTRERVDSLEDSMAYVDPYAEPDWVGRLERSVDDAARDSGRAAEAAESARDSAERACREVGGFLC